LVDQVRAAPTSAAAAMMENQRDHDRSDVHHIKRAKPLVSRTRLVMILLLIVAIPVFLKLANKVVHENADAIRQTFNP
jgi:hypothetical protein